MSLQLLLLDYYIQLAALVFAVHDGTPLALWETRTVNLNVRKNFAECRNALNRDFYYIKKREATSSKGGDLRGFQFIASMSSVVDPNDPQEQRDPPTFPDKPNEFFSQIAYVFCEFSLIQGLQNVKSALLGCGIEDLLVQLCFEDPHVHQFDARGKQLDLSHVFKDDEAKRELVRAHCRLLVGVRMPSKIKSPGGVALQGLTEQTRKTMDFYFEAGWKLGFDNIFVKSNAVNCNEFVWELFQNGVRGDYAQRDRNFLKDIHVNERTRGTWYFCQTKSALAQSKLKKGELRMLSRKYNETNLQ